MLTLSWVILTLPQRRGILAPDFCLRELCTGLTYPEIGQGFRNSVEATAAIWLPVGLLHSDREDWGWGYRNILFGWNSLRLAKSCTLANVSPLLWCTCMYARVIWASAGPSSSPASSVLELAPVFLRATWSLHCIPHCHSAGVITSHSLGSQVTFQWPLSYIWQWWEVWGYWFCLRGGGWGSAATQQPHQGWVFPQDLASSLGPQHLVEQWPWKLDTTTGFWIRIWSYAGCLWSEMALRILLLFWPLANKNINKLEGILKSNKNDYTIDSFNMYSMAKVGRDVAIISKCYIRRCKYQGIV